MYKIIADDSGIEINATKILSSVNWRFLPLTIYDSCSVSGILSNPFFCRRCSHCLGPPALTHLVTASSAYLCTDLFPPISYPPFATSKRISMTFSRSISSHNPSWTSHSNFPAATSVKTNPIIFNAMHFCEGWTERARIASSARV